MNIIDEFLKTHPAITVAAVLLGTAMGTGGVGIYGNVMFASQNYVDSKIVTLAEDITRVQHELTTSQIRIKYQFALQHKREVEKEIFELEQLKQSSGPFTLQAAKRLDEKQNELRDVLDKIAEYRRLLNGDI